MVIQRGTMSRCQGLSHFVGEVFLDFDKRDRLADCSHEFTCIEFIKTRWLVLDSDTFYLLWRNVDTVVVIDMYSYRDIILNISRGKGGKSLHRENYFCKRMLG